MEIKYAFDPDSSFVKFLDLAYRTTGDLTKPLTQIARDWFRGNKSIFALKGPGRYKDLSTKPFFAWWEKNPNLRTMYNNGYRSYKAAKYGSAYPILKATGVLAASITNREDDNSINRIEGDKKTLTLGTSVPYGIYHQSDSPRTKIPYRPFLFVGVEQIAPNDIKQKRVENWIKIIDSYLTQSLNKK